MKKKKTIGIGRFVFNIPVALILIIIAMMVLVPVVWVTLSAFKTEKEIISWPPTFIPKTFTLENFVDVQGRIDIIRYIMNSVIYAGATTALAVIVNGAAFAGALVSLLPMFILYMFGQKYFVEGMSSGGLKG